jgi:hypothetical protein
MVNNWHWRVFRNRTLQNKIPSERKKYEGITSIRRREGTSDKSEQAEDQENFRCGNQSAGPRDYPAFQKIHLGSFQDEEKNS